MIAPNPVGVVEKRCTKCGNVYPATAEYFYRDKRCRDGLKLECIVCKKARQKTYYQHPEVRERKLAWQKSHYYKSIAQGKTQPKIREGIHAYWRVRKHTRDACKKAVLGMHTTAQLHEQLMRQRHKCYYCHARFKKTKGKYIYHVDHTFPLSRVVGTDIPANDINYLVLTCPFCNQSKGDKFPWEFFEGGRLL